MMGTKTRNFTPLPNLSLEELVPKDNFYRRLEATLDLSFVRELTKDCYASSGRPSVDPVVFFRLQMVMFFEDIRSERQLMEVAADRLSVRWYLGYDLNEPLPDHCSLTKIRERYGLEVFRGFFEQIVQMCVEAGLVRGEELFFDSTKVEANADIDSLASRFLIETHLSGLFEEPSTPEASATEPSTGNEPHTLPTSEDEALITANAAKSDWISHTGKQDRSFSSGARQRTSDLRVSRTDPDATPMLMGEGEAKLGYQTYYVVDGGKARVILNALVTPSEVTENRPMLDLLWNTIFRWRIRPCQATGDARYGTRQNVAALEKAGIRAYVGISNFDFRDTGRFGPGHFRYDAQGNHYVCPAGRIVRFQKKTTTTGARGTGSAPRSATPASSRRGAPPASVDVCCTDPSRRTSMTECADTAGLSPTRKPSGRGRCGSSLYSPRPRIGTGSERFRLRRLKKVNKEALLTASGQNVKRLLAFGGS